MIDCIIFSKNRAAQLQLLIESIERFAPRLYNNIYVIYKATTKDHETTYNYVASKYYHITFIEEENLVDNQFEKITKSIINHINSYNTPLLTFLVDDDIFFRPPRIKSEQIHEIIYHTKRVFSLRLGKRYKYLKDFMVHKNYITIPRDINVKCAAYPLSVDGNIFDTKFITKLIDKISFINPNKLESRLQKFTPQCSNMFSVIEQCLVGVPINRVSDTSHCTFGENHYLNEDEICKQFLEGKRFNLDDISFKGINNTHVELKMEMK